MRPAMTRKAPSHKDAPRIAALLWAFGLPVLLSPPAQAAPARFGGRPNAAPASGTIGPNGPTITYNGTAMGSGAMDEGSAMEGVNADTFTVNVMPGDYTNKFIKVSIDSDIPANDYDLYVHKGSNAGPLVTSSANGAPPSHEEAAINPSVTGPGIYTVHVLYFAAVATPVLPPAPAGQYRGTLSIVTKAAGSTRTASYTVGGFTFSPDVPLRAPLTNSDGEPSSRTDTFGNVYISGIRGFPAGVDLWYFDLQPNSPTYDPFMRFPQYRGQPDGFVPDRVNKTGLAAGGDGGGDIDLAVGFGTTPDPVTGVARPPTLAFASLIAANLSTGNSTNQGQNFTLNPVGNSSGGISADDRQWLEFFGSNSVYILYRTLAPAVAQIQRSNDGGLTYGLASTTQPGASSVATVGQIGQTGAIDVDPVDGTVFISGSSGVVGVGTPETDPTTGRPSTTLMPIRYNVYQAASDPAGVAHLFFQVAVARDSATNGSPHTTATPNGYGTVYVTYSTDRGIFLEHSLDRGKTWSAPVQVNIPFNAAATAPDIAANYYNVFPRMALGTQYGSVGLVWYASDNRGQITGTSSVGDQTARWRVYYALTRNATAASPTFQNTLVSNHAIHAGNISEGGLVTPPAPNPNRNLLDYFEVSFDPAGAAVIAYTDDHSDFSGNTFATREIAGPSINGTPVAAASPGPNAGPQTTPALFATPRVPGPNGEQVTDFPQDQGSGLVLTTPTTSPFDVTAIKYYSVLSPRGPTIVATMTVSSLPVVPPSASYRMNFAVNCPEAGQDPTGTYSFALSDLGDQFFVQAITSAQGVPTYQWGSAVRNTDGSLTYTVRGLADAGSFDTIRHTITVRVSASVLNTATDAVTGQPLLTHGPAIDRGTILSGLRGEASGGSGVAIGDSTYGGTDYRIP